MAASVTGTFFFHADARHKEDFTLDTAQLLDLIRSHHAPRKEDLRWIKLAGFGQLLSKRGSLRHDKNVQFISGVEADYDDGRMTFDEAVQLIADAGIEAIAYTSPSHTPEHPRWRVLCPFVDRWKPNERSKFLARLNGILHGVIANESWTLSQSYYIGFTDPEWHQVEYFSGDDLARRDNLDAGAIGKTGKQRTGTSRSDSYGDYEGLDDLIENIRTGKSLHPSVTAIAGKCARNNVPKQFCLDLIGYAFDRADTDRYGNRWKECVDAVDDIYSKEQAKRTEQTNTAAITDAMFYYHSEENKFIFTPTGALWVAKAVNSRLPWYGGASPASIIARSRAVEQATWAPGKPQLIEGQLIHSGVGWVDHRGARVWNYYKPPTIIRGNSINAKRWVDHCYLIYPDEAAHIIKWLAMRVQHPEVKIQHALVLGGNQGIGKDTLIYPAVHAVGPWNVHVISPVEAMGTFTGYRQSVLLVVSEARNLGEVNRPQFYERFKDVIASPLPLYVNEKNRHEFYIPNIIGVIITTNHKTDGIYLDADDRRHFVCWSTLSLADFDAAYFTQMWERYYFQGGLDDIASYLRDLDVRDFKPGEPPPKTPAFWEICDAGQHPEIADIENTLDALAARNGGQRPTVVTFSDLIGINAEAEFVMIIKKNRRVLSRWMEQAGYKAVHNPDNAKQGLWWIGEKNQVVYGKSSIPTKDLIREIERKRGGRPH